jgi:hypothetical protein
MQPPHPCLYSCRAAQDGGSQSGIRMTQVIVAWLSERHDVVLQADDVGAPVALAA